MPMLFQVKTSIGKLVPCRCIVGAELVRRHFASIVDLRLIFIACYKISCLEIKEKDTVVEKDNNKTAVIDNTAEDNYRHY